MPKSSGKKRSREGCWSRADHEVREQSLQKTDRQRQRTAVLSHDTKDKRAQLKLKLNLKKITRHVDALKERLKTWDPVAEKEQVAKEEERRRIAAQQALEPKKKRKRPGPETWKLKGAARPAHLVYDFDVRYQCPHQQALDDTKAKAARQVNLLTGTTTQDAHALSVIREYMAALMEWGHLCVASGKSPAAAWTECRELEARYRLEWTTAQRDLLEWHLSRKEYAQAEELLNHPKKEKKEDANNDVYSVFANAWLAKELDRETVQDKLVRAIRHNPFCAFYLSFFDTFESVFEYKEDIADADDVPQSSLEEAIEYSDTAGAQWKSNGADEQLRRLLLEAWNGQSTLLSRADLEWEGRLKKIEEACQDRGEGPDVSMYAGMFRTAMEMLQDSGALSLQASHAGCDHTQ